MSFSLLQTGAEGGAFQTVNLGCGIWLDLKVCQLENITTWNLKTWNLKSWNLNLKLKSWNGCSWVVGGVEDEQLGGQQRGCQVAWVLAAGLKLDPRTALRARGWNCDGRSVPAGRERPEHFRLSIWDVGSGPQGSWVPQVGVAGRCHGPAGSGRLARRRGQTAGAPGGWCRRRWHQSAPGSNSWFPEILKTWFCRWHNYAVNICLWSFCQNL